MHHNLEAPLELAAPLLLTALSKHGCHCIPVPQLQLLHLPLKLYCLLLLAQYLLRSLTQPSHSCLLLRGQQAAMLPRCVCRLLCCHSCHCCRLMVIQGGI